MVFGPYPAAGPVRAKVAPRADSRGVLIWACAPRQTFYGSAADTFPRTFSMATPSVPPRALRMTPTTIRVGRTPRNCAFVLSHFEHLDYLLISELELPESCY